MKRKIIKRNKIKLSLILKLDFVYRKIILNDQCDLKRNKRTKYKRIERPDLAYTIGKRGSIMVPIRISSYNKKSRIQDKLDGSRYVRGIEEFNKLYDLNVLLEDIPKKSKFN